MHILSVNVGNSRAVIIKQQTVQTGLYKLPQSGPVPVNRLGLLNDVRIEPRPWGQEHHAVYAYPHEHYAYWERELGREPFPTGQFGENLTVTGMLEEEVRIGDIFRFGNTILQVAQPRIPCAKLNDRMGMRFSPVFMASRKVGFYLRVLQEGSIAPGDNIELLERDEASPTMEEFVRVTQFESWDALALQHLLQARDLMPAWREIIETKLARTQTARGWHGVREFAVVRREQESEDTVSLYLQCIRGRALAPFHGGQRLTVVLGGHSAHQQRRTYALSGSPQDLTNYRITVRRMVAPDDTLLEGVVSSHLVAMQVGEHILCTAPHGPLMHTLPQTGNERIPVLLSQGLGIAPMLSHLYELEAKQANTAYLFHEPATSEPQGLLREIHTLLGRNAGFQLTQISPDINGQIDVDLIGRYVQLAQADIHIAGPRDFVERLSNDLQQAGIDPTALIAQSFG